MSAYLGIALCDDMKINAEYKYVNSADAYLPESLSKLDRMHLRYVKKIYIVGRASIKQAEKLLHSYNEERYRLAYLFNGVAGCILDKSKGIEINVKKDTFCTKEIKRLQNEMKPLHKSLKIRVLCEKIFGICMAIALVLLALGGLYPAIKIRSFGVPFINIILSYNIFVIIAMLVLCFIGSVDNSFKRRLHNAIGDAVVKDFDNMYSRLTLAEQNGNRFFYDVDQGSVVEAEKAFNSTGVICDANKNRLFVSKKLSSDNVLGSI